MIQQGANVNYHPPRHDKYAPETIILPIYFAMNATEQGVKNMAQIIKHGAKLHNIPDTIETPLEIAVRNNDSPMIQLLLPYEKPKVATLQERRIKEFTIGESFAQENFDSIKTLLKLGLITANQGLNECIKYEISNPEIINYLFENGANRYSNNSLDYITQKAFPISQTYVLILHCLIENYGAFNKEALEKISELKNILIAIENDLKKNSPK